MMLIQKFMLTESALNNLDNSLASIDVTDDLGSSLGGVSAFSEEEDTWLLEKLEKGGKDGYKHMTHLLCAEKFLLWI